ncbi:sugar transferase [Tenacibaculum sp. nBUS_03]|uniref:sugar transferase n=1 Tax=Tenacibaculum sp. nBUS_03 TaxID=3395320 RepID=UPI003EB9E8D8
MKVLYVGLNSEKFVKATEKYLFSIESAENGMEALSMIKKRQSYSMIISEYDLSGNNGIYLYQLLQEDIKSKNIPFILISKVFNNDQYETCFKTKITDYFVWNASTVEDVLKRVNSILYTSLDLESDIKEIESTKSLEVYKLPLSKRIFDIVFSLFVLLLVLPLLILVIICIKVESRGNFYYVTKRVGRKTFNFYKLRSMRTGADSLLKKLSIKNNLYKPNTTSKVAKDECPRCKESNENETCSTVLYIDNKKICEYWYNVQKINSLNHTSKFIKIPNDPRVTSVGKFIRNTSIDELPQLINVLKGDMSIVGNRPLPLYEAELLTDDYMAKRFLAPAGITGLWQVELRGKKGKMSEEERMKLDNIYSDHFTNNNYSLWFDLKILLRTIPALLQKTSV